MTGTATIAAILCALQGPVDAGTPVESAAQVAPPAITADGLEALVPEIAAYPYRLAPGPRPFQYRLSFSPAIGTLGTKRLFAARVAYHPNEWLGWEGAIAHNPGSSVHAVLHTLNALIRRPVPGRTQPYLTGGYGMILVFPGTSLNADPVTKNTLSIGGGLEFYIRDDLALRAEIRDATVIGRQSDREGNVVYQYLQGTIGLSFYRAIGP